MVANASNSITLDDVDAAADPIKPRFGAHPVYAPGLSEKRFTQT